MDGSSYIRALNGLTETFRGISYTNVYTRYDEVVRPPESGALTTGEGRITNVLIQDVCALDTSPHLMLATADQVGFALAIDALEPTGPRASPRARGPSPSEPSRRLAAT